MKAFGKRWRPKLLRQGPAHSCAACFAMTTRYAPTCGEALCVEVHDQRRQNAWSRKQYAAREERAPDICRMCQRRRLPPHEIEAGNVNCQECRAKAAQRTRRRRDPQTVAHRAALARLDPSAGIRRARKVVMGHLEAGRARKRPSTSGKPRIKATLPPASPAYVSPEELAGEEPPFAQEPPWHEPEPPSYVYIVPPIRERPWLLQEYEEL